jgi:hypothetical protein
MGNIGLMEQTQQFLDLAVPGSQDIDAKVRHLIEAGHLRKECDRRYRHHETPTARTAQLEL